MYSILQEKKTKLENGDSLTTELEKKVAKGIGKSEIKNTLRHEHYKQCLFNETVTINSMNMIRSKCHELFMDTVVKKGLCSFDDKRYWKNPIESYVIGHYQIKEL